MAQNPKDKKLPVEKPMDKKKNIIIGAIVLILLLNIMWTILQSKFTPKLDEVKAEMAKLEQRITKLEQGGLPDVADLREEFSALKSISKTFSESLNNSIKAEEERLAAFEAQVEAQKSRVEALKKLTPAAN